MNCSSFLSVCMWIILWFVSNILRESYYSSHFDPHPVMLVAISTPVHCQQKAQQGENRGKNSVTFFKNITRTSNTTELQGFALAPGWRSVTWNSQLTQWHLRQRTQCHLRQSADPVSPETDSWQNVTWDSQTSDPVSPKTADPVSPETARPLTQCHLKQTADPVLPEPVRQLTQCFLKQEAIFFPFPPIFSAAFLTTSACKASSVAWMSTLLPPQLTASRQLPLLCMWMPLGSMAASVFSLELYGGQYN